MTKITRRAFGFLSTVPALALVSGSAFAAAAGSTASAQSPFDIMPYVNPEFRAFAEQVEKYGSGSITNEALAAMRKQRQMADASAPPIPADPPWAERMIPGRAGAPDVRIYVINSKPDAGVRPAVLHMHGGGFVFGDARSAIHQLQGVTKALDCVAVTVDYRLAPETPFPGPLEDNYAALKWLYDRASELGVDKSRIAVMGESAGGGHAAMLAIAARDRGEVPLVYQALTYPMLDDRTGSTRKVPPYMGDLIWSPGSNRFGWSALLGLPAGSAHVPYGAVPARVDNLKGLPPAFIGVGSIDLFVDEDITYARRLIDAGIPAELNIVPGGFHGFDSADTPIAKQFKTALLDALRRAIAPVS